MVVPVRYVLAVLSHGDDEDRYLADTLMAFDWQVSPTPILSVRVHDRPPLKGFCHQTRTLWADAIRVAGEMDAEYVFWLEHDFHVTRPVDLRQLAAVLDADHGIAQMALVRNAVNATELAAGGLVASRPGEFTDEGGWLSHRSYFTTNPSLMRTAFMAEHPFGTAGGKRLPQDIRCEGEYGIALREAGFRFGVWGGGEEWVRHVGHRDGRGY